MGSEGKRRASGVPGRSMSLVPTLSAEQGAGAAPRTDNRVIINVGGVKYETFKSTLKNIPDTRLSWITETTSHNSDYDPETREYFFDRHPGVFNMVLNYYRTGKLHTPTDVCGPMFEEELAFWGIDEKQIEPCCWMTYRTHRDAEETLAELDGFNDDSSEDEADNIAMRFGIMEEDRPVLSCWETWQPKMWKILEEPNSSKAAQVMAVISTTFVLLSICVLSLETHLSFRVAINQSEPVNSDWSVAEINSRTYPVPVLAYLDLVCVIYFTIEFITRLTFSPSKLDFWKNALNWVDVVAVLPYYIEKIILLNSGNVIGATARSFFMTIRMVRILRIFKLTRHFSGLKILGHTIKASAKEMLLLVMFLVIFILIFACLVYLTEQVEEHPLNKFKNIPVGLWWACVTMTTLGYGDFYPRTVLGYLVGALCAVAGVLVIALPVPVIVNNFAMYYNHAQARQKLPKKRRRILVGAADMLKTQTDMPGESFAEPEQATSPTRTNETRSERKESTESVNTVDSGIKSGGSNSSSGGSSAGISIVFTDETSVGDSAKTVSDFPPDVNMADTGQAALESRSSDNSSASQRISHKPNMELELNVNTIHRENRRNSLLPAKKDSLNSQSSRCSDQSTKSRRRQSLRPGPAMTHVEV